MTEGILEDVWNGARRELEDDYVGLWELVRRLRRRLPDLDDQGVRNHVLVMIDRGLRRGEAEAGNGAIPGGLENVWSEPIDEIVERIRREWSLLARDPIPGEIVWLDQPRLDLAAQSEVVANPSKTFIQPDGRRVFVRQLGDRYNVVMQREHGRPGSWKGISEEALNQLVRNFGWRPD